MLYRGGERAFEKTPLMFLCLPYLYDKRIAASLARISLDGLFSLLVFGLGGLIRR